MVRPLFSAAGLIAVTAVAQSPTQQSVDDANLIMSRGFVNQAGTAVTSSTRDFKGLGTTHGTPCNLPDAPSCKPLVCNITSGSCAHCRRNKDCKDRHEKCDSGLCRQKTLREAFDMFAILAIVIAILTCGIAGVAGVGGGGILVPLYAVTLSVPLPEAVALSQATITGQSLLTVSNKLRLRHPQHDRPLINWVLMTFWLPCSLGGTSVGNLIGKTVPDWFRIVILLLLLSYTLARVVIKARAQRAADKLTQSPSAQAVADDASDTESGTQVGEEGRVNVEGASDTHSDRGEPDTTNTAPAKVERGSLSCREIFQPYPFTIIAGTFIPLELVNYFLSENAGFVECGSDVFIAVFVGCFVYNIGCSIGIRMHLRRIFYQILEADDVTDQENDQRLPFRWNMKTSVWFPLIAITAGGAASLLGIGGGLILGALFLEAGLTPEEVSATSGTATLLVASASLLQYVIQGEVPADYGAMLGASGIVGSVLGIFLQREIKRRGASYLIVAALATVMGGSMVALTAVGLFDTYEDWKEHKYLGFSSPCH